MVKLFSICCFVIFSLQAYSQPSAKFVMGPILKSTYRAQGLIAASATFSPSIMLNRASNNFYLSGFAEYHLDEKVSLRSDNFYYLNSSEESSFVDNAFRTYFGAYYHLNQRSIGNWDVKLGFQPGITFMRIHESINGEIQISRTVTSPSFLTSLGFDYYVWKYFHFFTNLTYMNSKLSGLISGPHKTDELVFSAGLGFQIKTNRN